MVKQAEGLLFFNHVYYIIKTNNSNLLCKKWYNNIIYINICFSNYVTTPFDLRVFCTWLGDQSFRML